VEYGHRLDARRAVGAPETAMPSLSAPPALPRRAIVAGASLGGLLAARVCADHFDEVLVLDRDALPATAERRKGAPQAVHAHGLISTGREILEGLFPGLTDSLVARGAVVADAGLGSRRLIDGSYHVAFEARRLSLSVSRLLLEHAVRARVLANPRVRVVGRTEVVTPCLDAAARRVTAVRVIERDSADGGRTVPCDLFVDATGRGSRLPRWLEALGYPAPTEDRVDVDIRYATRHYRRKPTHLGGQNVCILALNPPGRRAGVMLAVEGDRWVVSVGGLPGDHPPLDAEGFERYVKGLPGPDIAQTIADSEPLGDVEGYGFPASVHRRYDRLERFPDGCLAFGDAISSFNPIYGQGMTVAALEARALRELLASGAEDLAPRFFREASRLIEIPWSIAVGNDLRYGTGTSRRDKPKAIRAYLRALHRAASRDVAVARAFAEVLALRQGPASLLAPRVAWRVGVAWLLERFGTTRGVAPSASAAARPATLTPAD
jgi:2-polyprenyl-6-methoxyphenol hydroxylase-like FAD-dependent oxidoreductase